jgi:hypothetical protein
MERTLPPRPDDRIRNDDTPKRARGIAPYVSTSRSDFECLRLAHARFKTSSDRFLKPASADPYPSRPYAQPAGLAPPRPTTARQGRPDWPELNLVPGPFAMLPRVGWRDFEPARPRGLSNHASGRSRASTMPYWIRWSRCVPTHYRRGRRPPLTITMRACDQGRWRHSSISVF